MAIASAQTCTLCPNEKKPRNGNTIIFHDGTELETCKELAKDIIEDLDGDACGVDPFARAIQVVCGCPGVKAGPCPGICGAGFTLAEPSALAINYGGLTCSVVDQFFRGIPGETICGSEPANRMLEEAFCVCKEKVKPGQNMGGGAGTGMNGMAGGRKLRLGDLEERFPPRAARGLAM